MFYLTNLRLPSVRPPFVHLSFTFRRTSLVQQKTSEKYSIPPHFVRHPSLIRKRPRTALFGHLLLLSSVRCFALFGHLLASESSRLLCSSLCWAGIITCSSFVTFLHQLRSSPAARTLTLRDFKNFDKNLPIILRSLIRCRSFLSPAARTRSFAHLLFQTPSVPVTCCKTSTAHQTFV